MSIKWSLVSIIALVCHFIISYRKYCSTLLSLLFFQRQAPDLDDDVFTDETGMLCRNRLSTSSVRTWITWQNYRGIPIFVSSSLLVRKAISRGQTYVWPGKRSQFWVKSSGGSKNWGFEKWSFHFCKDDINIADMFKASIRGSGFVEKIREWWQPFHLHHRHHPSTIGVND